MLLLYINSQVSHDTSADFDCTRISNKAPLKKPVSLGASDTLKIILTTTEDGKAKRPHQAFLLLQDQDTGVEATLPFTVKDSGKAKVDVVRLPFIWLLPCS